MVAIQIILSMFSGVHSFCYRLAADGSDFTEGEKEKFGEREKLDSCDKLVPVRQ